MHPLFKSPRLLSETSHHFLCLMRNGWLPPKLSESRGEVKAGNFWWHIFQGRIEGVDVGSGARETDLSLSSATNVLDELRWVS